jgi:anaerobic selenocysteine-containing dehydrogenase
LLEKYPLILSTGNRNLFYTHGQFREIESLKEKNPEPQAEMGPKTALQYKIREGDKIVVETNRGVVQMKAHVDERVAEGIVLVPHGWPREANANLLTDAECREPIMGYPDMKSLLCAIRKA